MTTIDTHFHTLESKCASWNSWLDTVIDIKESMLDYICITDHGSMHGYLHLLSRYPYISKKIFPGIEISTPSHGDFLVYNEEVGFLKSFERVYNLDTLKKLLENSGSAVVWAHPFFNPFFSKPNSLESIPEIIELIDGIEMFNGINPESKKENLKFSNEAQKYKRLSLTGGSDTHKKRNSISSYTFFESVANYSEFISELKKGNSVPQFEEYR